MNQTEHTQAQEAARQFLPDDGIQSITPFGNGHINDTFRVEYQDGRGIRKTILQRINHDIFKHPEEVMENILKITDHLRKRIVAEGGDPARETLNVICTRDGMPYYKNQAGEYYRMYGFVERTVSYDAVSSVEDFYASAVAFGHFQCMLSDFPAQELHETIPAFHDTKARFSRFLEVLKEDKLGRAAGVQPEIQFVLDREGLAGELLDLQARGELPLRVTHNDTKLNNILMDEDTGAPICVVDLDTVMPGLAVNDFGDSIRFGASTGAEDERDLDKVECSMELFDAYTRGFLQGCEGRLTQAECKALSLGAKTMTFECGMRFLTDYLEGDVYFKISREGHNLDRCRTQFKLVADMEKKWAQMQRIVEKYQDL